MVVLGNTNRKIMTPKLLINLLCILACVVLASCTQSFNQWLSSQEIYQSLQNAGKVGLHINFKTNSYALTGRSAKQIGEVVKALKQIDTSKYYILVIGHTDKRGDKDANKLLSLNRAAAVVNALIDKYKFPPEKLRWDGKGEMEPLVSPELTDHDRFMNRRVEIILEQK